MKRAKPADTHNRTEQSRVALFLPSLAGGGAERVMVTLARALAERGQDVQIVLACGEGPHREHVPSAVNVVNLSARRVLWSLPSLVGYLRKQRPHVLLSTLSHANLVALAAARVARVNSRIVIREATTLRHMARRSSRLKTQLMPLMMRTLYPRAHAIIAVSEAVADDVRRATGISPDKLHVVHNPVPVSEIREKADQPVDHPWLAEGNPPVILSVGRLTQAKDHASLIQAFCRVLQCTDCRLIVLGEGEERPALERLVSSLGLSESVRLLGHVSNPYSFMKKSAVLVLSSRREGCPNALIEALALGVPIVAANCPSGPAEILEGGKLGTLVPVGDVVAMEKAILASLRGRRTEGLPDVARFDIPSVLRAYAEIMGIVL